MAAPLTSLPLVGHVRAVGERPAASTIDAGRARWLAERYGPVLREEPRLGALRDALLAHGGWEIVPATDDPQIDGLVSGRARVWDGTGVRRTRGGAVSRCHGNAALAFLRRWPVFLVATGYALSDDGVWRQHSWLMEHRDGAPTRVAETTVGRVLYAGVTLDPAGTPSPTGRFLPGGLETMRFCLANLESVVAGSDARAVVEDTLARAPLFAEVMRAALDGRGPGPRPHRA